MLCSVSRVVDQKVRLMRESGSSCTEPCGISQMLAMREGQPCVAHAVGGLKDTVQHGINGFVFSVKNLNEQVDSFVRTTLDAVALRPYFGVMHFGDHNLTCGIREYMDGKSYQHLLTKIFNSFEKADFPEVLRIQDHYFESSRYSLKSLFRDEQRKIPDMILKATETDAQSACWHLFEHHVPR